MRRPQDSQNREKGLASAPQNWQLTLAISAKPSTDSAPFCLALANNGVEDGDEVESKSARLRSSPQFLQKSHPLRQEVPQW